MHLLKQLTQVKIKFSHYGTLFPSERNNTPQLETEEIEWRNNEITTEVQYEFM